jgi:hypothetical protein
MVRPASTVTSRPEGSARRLPLISRASEVQAKTMGTASSAQPSIRPDVRRWSGNQAAAAIIATPASQVTSTHVPVA